MFMNIAIFAAPSLRSLFLNIPITQKPLSGPLSDLVKGSPNLEHIDLAFKGTRVYKPGVPIVPEGLTEILLALPKLRKLRVPNKWTESEQFHLALSQMPLLASLEFSAVTVTPKFKLTSSTPTKDPPDANPFRVLSNLHLSISPASAELNCFVPSLVSLFVDLQGSKYEAVRSWMSALPHSCPHLQYFVVASSLIFVRRDATTDLTLPRNIFQCALGLRKLKIFEILLELPLGVTDDDLDDAARSWPSIEILILCPDPAAIHASEPNSLILATLGCLQSFARHCRSLTHLALQVVATIPLEQLPTDEFILSKRFKELTVTASQIDSPYEVAAYLVERLSGRVKLGFQTGSKAYDLPASFKRTLSYGVNRSASLVPETRLKWDKVKELMKMHRESGL